MRKICSFLALVLAAPFLHAQPSTEEIVAKARQYLGGDDALDSIRSIIYEADFSATDGSAGTMKIMFQKPLQQRVEIIREEMGEVSVLNDFDGWQKIYDLNDEARWSLTLLNPEKIKELQANTFENLHFFRGIESRRGWIENKGVTTIDGQQTVELTFNYPGGAVFRRFFDTENGRLLLTETTNGSQIREEGKILVDGVVFPETLTLSRDGEVLNRIHFKKIVLNEKIDSSEFEVPMLVQ